jgi:YidC/Oxa1 family membrane protein insertase
MTPVFATPLQPLIDAADWLLGSIHDVGFSWGMSIILLTVIVRLLLVPLTIKQIRSMNALRALQPQLKEIQEKYKGDRQAMNQATMRFYQENKVNPFASCLPLLLQLPVFLALFNLLRSTEFKDEVGNAGFLFISSLTQKATGAELFVLMALFIGSQIASTLVMTVSADKTQQRIMLLLPLVFATFVVRFPAGLVLYWITTNFWTLGQQLVVRRVWPPPPPVVGGRVVTTGTPATAGAPAAAAGPGRKPPPPPRKRKRRRR